MRLLKPASIVLLFLAFSTFLLPSTWRPGCDFTWRYNEVQCLRTGLDPYDVCFNEVESPEFRSIFRPEPDKRPVNSYTPWQYTWFLPLSYLPLQTAHTLFMGLNLFALGILMGCAYHRAKRLHLSAEKALATAAAASFLGLALIRVLQVSNYGLLMAAALMLMAEFPRWTVPSLCVLMIKPQVGILFVIPLLFTKRWRPLLVAGLFTAASTIPAAIMCHANPIRMTLRVLFSGTHSIRAAEIGTPLFPPPLVNAFASIAPARVWVAFSAVVGLYLCIMASKRLAKHPDYAVQLLPATVISLLWMPAHFHDRLLMALPLMLFAAQVLQGHRPARRLYLLFAAEFPLCLLAGIAALAFYPHPTALVQNPIARTSYDWMLFLIGWLQVGCACHYCTVNEDLCDCGIHTATLISETQN